MEALLLFSTTSNTYHYYWNNKIQSTTPKLRGPSISYRRSCKYGCPSIILLRLPSFPSLCISDAFICSDLQPCFLLFQYTATTLKDPTLFRTPHQKKKSFQHARPSRFSHLPPSSFSSEEPSCNNWAFSIPK